MVFLRERCLLGEANEILENTINIENKKKIALISLGGNLHTFNFPLSVDQRTNMRNRAPLWFQ